MWMVPGGYGQAAAIIAVVLATATVIRLKPGWHRGSAAAPLLALALLRAAIPWAIDRAADRELDLAARYANIDRAISHWWSGVQTELDELSAAANSELNRVPAADPEADWFAALRRAAAFALSTTRTVTTGWESPPAFGLFDADGQPVAWLRPMDPFALEVLQRGADWNQTFLLPQREALHAVRITYLPTGGFLAVRTLLSTSQPHGGSRGQPAPLDLLRRSLPGLDALDLSPAEPALTEAELDPGPTVIIESGPYFHLRARYSVPARAAAEVAARNRLGLIASLLALAGMLPSLVGASIWLRGQSAWLNIAGAAAIAVGVRIFLEATGMIQWLAHQFGLNSSNFGSLTPLLRDPLNALATAVAAFAVSACLLRAGPRTPPNSTFRRRLWHNATICAAAALAAGDAALTAFFVRNSSSRWWQPTAMTLPAGDWLMIWTWLLLQAALLFTLASLFGPLLPLPASAVNKRAASAVNSILTALVAGALAAVALSLAIEDVAPPAGLLPARWPCLLMIAAGLVLAWWLQRYRTLTPGARAIPILALLAAAPYPLISASADQADVTALAAELANARDQEDQVQLALMEFLQSPLEQRITSSGRSWTSEPSLAYKIWRLWPAVSSDTPPGVHLFAADSSLLSTHAPGLPGLSAWMDSFVARIAMFGGIPSVTLTFQQDGGERKFLLMGRQFALQEADPAWLVLTCPIYPRLTQSVDRPASLLSQQSAPPFPRLTALAEFRSGELLVQYGSPVLPPETPRPGEPLIRWWRHEGQEYTLVYASQLQDTPQDPDAAGAALRHLRLSEHAQFYILAVFLGFPILPLLTWPLPGGGWISALRRRWQLARQRGWRFRLSFRARFLVLLLTVGTAPLLGLSLSINQTLQRTLNREASAAARQQLQGIKQRMESAFADTARQIASVVLDETGQVGPASPERLPPAEQISRINSAGDVRPLWDSATPPVSDADWPLINELLLGAPPALAYVQHGHQALCRSYVPGAPGEVLAIDIPLPAALAAGDPTAGQEVLAVYLPDQLLSSNREDLFQSGWLPGLADGQLVAAAAKRPGEIAQRRLVLSGQELQASLAVLPAPDGTSAAYIQLISSADLLTGSATLGGRLGVFPALIAGTFVMLALISLALARMITRPVSDLIDGTRRLAAGDRSARIRENLPGELGELGIAFNAMTRGIADAEQRLRDRGRFIETLLTQLPAGVCAFATDGTVEYANPALANLLGLSAPPENLTQLAGEIAPAGPRIIAPLAQTRAGSIQAGVPIGERIRTLRGTATPLDSLPSGQPGRWLLIIEDLTDVVRAQKLAMWADMARRVAHEIKNPLTPIQLSVEHLRRVHADGSPRFSEIFDRCVATILDQVRDLQQISSAFSQFARLPQPQLALIRCGPVVSEVAELLRPSLAPGMTIDVDIASDPPVLADAAQLRRAVLNIAQNGLQAMARQQAGCLLLRVRTAAAGGRAEIVIADTGPGITPDAAEHLFEPYFSTKTAGTGLGLAIARRSIEEHGGDITVRSVAGAGAEFTIHLPLATVDGLEQDLR